MPHSTGTAIFLWALQEVWAGGDTQETLGVGRSLPGRCPERWVAALWRRPLFPGLSTSRRPAIRVAPSPNLPRVPNPVSHGPPRLLRTWGAVHSEGLGSGRNRVAGGRVEHMLGRFLWKVVAWDEVGGKMWVLEVKDDPTDQNRWSKQPGAGQLKEDPNMAGVGPLGPSERQPWFCKGCPG